MQGLSAGLLEDYGVLVMTAVATIVVGTRRAAQLSEKKKQQQEGETTAEETPQILSTTDAWQFPLLASAALLGLYALVRFVRADLLGLLITLYFSVLGALCVSHVAKPFVLRVLPVSSTFSLFHNHLAFDLADVAGTLCLGVPVAAMWAFSRHWLAANTLAVCFGVEAITFISLGSYTAGAALLGGLFVYDIFWVFGTHVMVAVVRGFDAPIKIAYPRSGVVSALLQGLPIGLENSMLGLGDIAVPGIFLALLLRVGKPYFRAGLAAYTIALSATMVVVHVFGVAQPALLYLVPACLGSSMIVAFVRGEVAKLISFKVPEPTQKAIAAGSSSTTTSSSSSTTETIPAEEKKSQ